MAVSTNAIHLRQAIFTRASAVAPSGYPTWSSTRLAAGPTITADMVPLLQVTIGREQLVPDGDDNTGPIRFISDTTIAITVVRGLDDPAVLDGQIDQDLAAILDALFTDNSFTNPPKGSPFIFEGVPRIDHPRGLIEQQTEAYFYSLTAHVSFSFRVLFSPPAPYWLEEVAIVPTYGGNQLPTAIAEVGQIYYQVFGTAPDFRINLEPGASFSGIESITISDGGAGGTIVPYYGAPGVGVCTVTPPNGAVTFPFTYVATGPGVILAFTNAQDWSDPAPIKVS